MAEAHPTKNIALETLRGLAAVSVLFWHAMLGFLPARSGIFETFDKADGVNTAIWFGLIHGTGAVVFFFVLSGYVLTRAYFADPDPSRLYRTALKRWPRLAMPVLASVFASWMLFALGLYSFEAVGALTGSPWLIRFGYANEVPFAMSLTDALAEGAFLTFFRGDANYNSSLWTMRYEFIGSYMAFALAFLLAATSSRAAHLYLVLVAVGLAHFANPLYAAFPAGVALALLLPRDRAPLTLFAGLACLAVAVYCLGYSGVRRGAYGAFAWLTPFRFPSVYLNILGALLLIAAVERCRPLHTALSAPWGAVLGRLSFPLYLVHVPVLCSLGCWAYLAAAQVAPAPYPVLAGGLATIAGSFVVAVPLAWLNEWWIACLAGIRLETGSSGAGPIPVRHQ